MSAEGNTNLDIVAETPPAETETSTPSHSQATTDSQVPPVEASVAAAADLGAPSGAALAPEEVPEEEPEEPANESPVVGGIAPASFQALSVANVFPQAIYPVPIPAPGQGYKNFTCQFTIKYRDLSAGMTLKLYIGHSTQTPWKIHRLKPKQIGFQTDEFHSQLAFASVERDVDNIVTGTVIRPINPGEYVGLIPDHSGNGNRWEQPTRGGAGNVVQAQNLTEYPVDLSVGYVNKTGEDYSPIKIFKPTGAKDVVDAVQDTVLYAYIGHESKPRSQSGEPIWTQDLKQLLPITSWRFIHVWGDKYKIERA